MSESTVKRKHQTQFHAGINDLPPGINYGEFNTLNRRCTEWLEWRAGKRPEPAWHMPARRRFQ